MKKIMLVLPMVLSIFAMGTAMAAIKPYCQEKITTGAFDYFPSTITLYDQLNNPIYIYYLEYGTANSQVTKTWIYQNSAVEPSYQGKLYFYAKGSYLPGIKPWSVILLSQGNIYCDEYTFNGKDMKCAAMAIYKVQKAGGGQETVCMEYEAHSTYSATDKDMIYVKAYTDGTPDSTGTCTGATNMVVDAETSCYFIRVPKMHVTFSEWDNFARFPMCKWMHMEDTTPV
jgi:hypothetical protein